MFILLPITFKISLLAYEENKNTWFSWIALRSGSKSLLHLATAFLARAASH